LENIYLLAVIVIVY